LTGLALGKTTTTGVRCVVRQSKTEVGSRIGSVGKRIQVVERATYLLHKLKFFRLARKNDTGSPVRLKESPYR